MNYNHAAIDVSNCVVLLQGLLICKRKHRLHEPWTSRFPNLPTWIPLRNSIFWMLSIWFYVGFSCVPDLWACRNPRHLKQPIWSLWRVWNNFHRGTRREEFNAQVSEVAECWSTCWSLPHHQNWQVTDYFPHACGIHLKSSEVLLSPDKVRPVRVLADKTIIEFGN